MNQDELNAVFRSLGRIGSARRRHDYVTRMPFLRSQGAIDALYTEVLRQARLDVKLAARIAEAIGWIAAELGDDYGRAQALRAAGHVRYTRARYAEAVESYRAARRIFRRLGLESETARTLSSAIQSLIYLGNYGEALGWAEEARRIFEKHSDGLRLARLDSNVANIYFRQDRFRQALALYKRAHESFEHLGTAGDIAAVLSNLAVCYTSVNEFDRALDTYRAARAHCERHGMSLLVAEADYNIAYLHFLRGEYQQAITLYDTARRACEALNDPYHRALCDLDQAEMYVELNLLAEGAKLAHSAIRAFERLGMRYERSKAMTFLAIALSRRRNFTRALRLFSQARALFARERNSIWPALIDLYCALVLFERGRLAQARALATGARKVFLAASAPVKAALCGLLLARIEFREGNFSEAQRRCEIAARRLDRADAPAVAYQAYYILGQILEAQGDNTRAHAAYRTSYSKLEHLRSQVRGQDLKIAFLKDKLAVYESLVWMCVEGDAPARDPAAALSYIEQAKSRTLADLLAAAGDWAPVPTAASEGVVQAVVQLRDKLNSYYRQLELQEMAAPAGPTSSMKDLRRRARDCENQLAALLEAARLNDTEFAAFHTGASIGLDAIRSSLEPGSVIVEYYRIRERLYACVFDKDRLEIAAVCPAAEARMALTLFRFQMSKFRLGREYTRRFGRALHAAAEAHLRSLYDLLLRPIRAKLGARHVIFVPHDFLHYLPFHALNSGSAPLISELPVSYAQSSSIFHLCRLRRPDLEDRSLVLGLPDANTPYIRDEVEAVVEGIPRAKAFLGTDADERRLRELGPNCRYIHIATHGFFRQDNPMLSSIRLGSSALTLVDIYRLHLPSELVTLSGCGTGLNAVFAGDELIGLVRGFLYAGARSVLVSLWDVNDKSTAEFMREFYRNLACSPDKAIALQRAMLAVRDRYPNPYHWAPFSLVGDPAAAI